MNGKFVAVILLAIVACFNCSQSTAQGIDLNKVVSFQLPDSFPARVSTIYNGDIVRFDVYTVNQSGENIVWNRLMKYRGQSIDTLNNVIADLNAYFHDYKLTKENEIKYKDKQLLVKYSIISNDSIVIRLQRDQLEYCKDELKRLNKKSIFDRIGNFKILGIKTRNIFIGALVGGAYYLGTKTN